MAVKSALIIILSFFSFQAAFAATSPQDADPPLVCANPKAKKELIRGFELQQDTNTDEALVRYQACLKLEPNCVSCLYEVGWTYWKKGQWLNVIQTWEQALKLNPAHSKVLQFLPTARENLKIVQTHLLEIILRQQKNGKIPILYIDNEILFLREKITKSMKLSLEKK